jgi:hypothetical protein
MNPTLQSSKGVITIDGDQSVDRTVEKLQAILEAKAIKLFTLIDHSGEAEKAGVHMPCPPPSY